MGAHEGDAEVEVAALCSLDIGAFDGTERKFLRACHFVIPIAANSSA